MLVVCNKYIYNGELVHTLIACWFTFISSSSDSLHKVIRIQLFWNIFKILLMNKIYIQICFEYKNFRTRWSAEDSGYLSALHNTTIRMLFFVREQIKVYFIRVYYQCYNITTLIQLAVSHISELHSREGVGNFNFDLNICVHLK